MGQSTEWFETVGETILKAATLGTNMSGKAKILLVLVLVVALYVMLSSSGEPVEIETDV